MASSPAKDSIGDKVPEVTMIERAVASMSSITLLLALGGHTDPCDLRECHGGIETPQSDRMTPHASTCHVSAEGEGPVPNDVPFLGTSVF